MIRDDQFDCAFGSSVWIGRANWAVLGDRNHIGNSSRITINGRGGGEDDIWDIVLGHAAEESDGAANIDAVVFEGDLGGFADCLKCTSRYLPI